MEQQVKDDWIINNQNIFGLQQDINLSLSSIQYEILNQLKGKKINSISDYLGAEIDISKEIQFTKQLNIGEIFTKFLIFENINPFDKRTFNCSWILRYLQLSLFKEYTENKHKNILTFSGYKTRYNSLLNNFLASNIDTDEQDFIKAELTLCNNLLTEMNKPVYSVLSPLNGVLDEPCEFKKNLTNSIDKRVKFLEQKANEKYPKVKALFQFIEYLHLQINNINKYNTTIEELNILFDKCAKLNRNENFADKLIYNKLQEKIDGKREVLYLNIDKKIHDKAASLKIYDGNDTFTIKSWNNSAIIELKDSFTEQEVPEILKYLNMYVDFKKSIDKYHLSSIFFADLDDLLEDTIKFFTGKDIKKKVQKPIPLPPQQSEKPKPELKLNDFFIKEVSSDTIAAIQTEFNELEGKDLAILIYLLHKEYKKIEILTNSRTKGRKGFVKCLKETDNPKMQKVNKCFVPNTDDLIYSKDDLVFQSLNKRLTETIKNIVV